MSKDKGKKTDGDPPVINQPICNNISSAVVGQQVNFTGIVGSCSITLGNTTWPFSWGPPINFPSVVNPAIYIASGLSNGSYQYIVSCCSTAGAPKTVIVG